MIFIATGANASANNLGKISIKTIDDITPQTIEILNYFGKTWSDDDKIAIDDFLVSFNSASWKTKVKVISMPILMPIQNKIPQSTLVASGSKFRKNIVDFNNELGIFAPFSDEAWGFIGVGQNGVVIQTNTAGDTPTTNIGVDLATTPFGITNKAAHYGVYFKSSSKFSSGQGINTTPVIISSANVEYATFFNNLSANGSITIGARKQLTILNGDVTVPSSKSYSKNGLINTSIINTEASVVQVSAGLIKRVADNIVDDSTACFMTFGNYMTDAELTEYAGLINTLMDSLVV